MKSLQFTHSSGAKFRKMHVKLQFRTENINLNAGAYQIGIN